MSCSRGPTPAEERFNSAFSGMRNIDKLLWYISSDFDGSRGWAEQEIRELSEAVKSEIDSMLRELERG